MQSFEEIKQNCVNNKNKTSAGSISEYQSANQAAMQYFNAKLHTKPYPTDFHLNKYTFSNSNNNVFCLKGNKINNTAIDIFHDVRSNFSNGNLRDNGFNYSGRLVKDIIGGWCSTDPNIMAYTINRLNGADIFTRIELDNPCELFTGYNDIELREESVIDLNLTPTNIAINNIRVKEGEQPATTPILSRQRSVSASTSETSITPSGSKDKIHGVINENTSHIFIPLNSLTRYQINKIDSLIRNDRYTNNRLVSYTDRGEFDPKLGRYVSFEVELLSKQKIDGVEGYVAPIGLKENVKQLLNHGSFEFELEDKRQLSDKNPFKLKETTSSGVKLDLRPYQKDIVKTAIEKGGGLISLPTGGGKTIIASEIIANLGHDTVFYVPNLSLFYNAKSQIESYIDTDKVNIGQVGGEKVDLKDDPNKVDINIVSIPMAYRVFNNVPTSTEKEQAVRRAAEMSDVMIVDEVHHLPADKYKLISINTPAKYRYGLSATPYREDGKDLEIIGGVGEKIGNMTVMDLVELGYLTPPEIYVIDNSDISPKDDYDVLKILSEPSCYSTLTNSMKKNVDKWKIPKKTNATPHYFRKANSMCNTKRNDRIVDLVSKLDKKGKTNIVFVSYTKHGQILVDQLRNNNIHAELLTGATESEIQRTEDEMEDEDIRLKARNALFKRMKDGELNTIVATGQIMGEGVDIPNIDSIILADESRSKTALVQKIGRALRLKEGKEKSLIFDFNDTTPIVGDWCMKRRYVYDDQGFPNKIINYKNIDRVLQKALGDDVSINSKDRELTRQRIQRSQLQHNYDKMKVAELKDVARNIGRSEKIPFSHLTKKNDLISFIIEHELKESEE